MSDSDIKDESTTDENDTLEDESSQPASGDEDPTDGDDGSDEEGTGLDVHSEPDEETKKEIEEEREHRLDPENRPDNVEVDNTPREFDVERGQFKDSDDYDDSEPAPFSDPEDPNNDDD